jgi:hypothetical protein
MLNSGGGEIWIGLGEERGRAVRVEAVEHEDRELNRLRDHFSDAIEPSPVSGEIRVEPIFTENHETILRVRVDPHSKRRPYALLEGTARHFLKRVEDRLRPMSREEVIRPQISADPVRTRATQKILQAREQQQNANKFWLRIQPLGGGELKLTKDFQDYFSNPAKTGNRDAGWNFIDPYQHMERERDGSIRFGEPDGILVRVFGDGAIEFTMPIMNLYWKSASGINEALGKEIWPYCLLEYPASVFRLARAIYIERDLEADNFLADVALFGLRGWTLRPHSPMSFAYKGLAKPKPLDADEIVSSQPLDFTREQMVESPDRCAFRLVKRIYEAFGLYEENMPEEFNQESGTLALPG